MLIQLFDNLTFRSKKFSVFCAKKLKRVLNLKYLSDILLLLSVTLASAFWQFESYYPWAGVVKFLASAFAILMWIYVSFISGFNRRESFVFFILGYWFIPQVFLIAISSIPSAEYSLAEYLLSIIANTLVHSPLMFIENHYKLNWHILVVSVVALSEIVFAVGYNFRYTLRRSEWYCQFRKHTHENKRSSL